MRFTVGETTLVDADVETLAIGAVADPELDDDADEVPPPALGPGAEEVSAALGRDLLDDLRALRFGGAAGGVARIPTRGAIPADSIVVVGLGKEADLDLEAVRKAGAGLAEAAAKSRSVATTVPAAARGVDPAGATQAFVEGVALAAYRFATYKSRSDTPRLDSVALHPAEPTDAEALRAGAATGRVVTDAARLARDLVNEPPGNKRPPALADRARAELDGTGVEVEVLDEDALREGGYGGMLAVGQGSEAPPRLVELRYSHPDARRHVALVGKGITFDSGGLSIKPSRSMMTMKMDMGGAAAVLATVKGAAELQLPVRLTGLMALAENLPSGTAQRPGDVYTARNGKTVEVLNTDAEGRLVLSDALSHASERSPDVIVDLATLTGAVVVALGHRIGGLMCDDDDLAAALLAAGERSGERLWRLPLPKDYRADLDSDVADLKNIGKDGRAGTIVAGLFLKEFVAEGIPWAHLDIAGIAWSDENSAYIRKGATGAPVRTLLTWLATTN